jgi:hypothetical protein
MRNKRATEEIVAYTSARSELWIILRAAFPVLVAEFARLFMIVTDTLFVVSKPKNTNFEIKSLDLTMASI